jgi:hypothetical protein
VHLTRRLPDIEHVADLVHELAHATRLEARVLRGEIEDTAEFVRERLTAKGGEADAFAVECQVKRELLGSWDALCAPYGITSAAGDSVDVQRVVKDLYNGQLSASLTGETYPIMLARQFRAILAKRTRASRAISAVENKRDIR